VNSDQTGHPGRPRLIRLFGLRKRVALVLGLTVAIGTLAGGVAWASIPASNGVISGCYSTKTGALSVIDAAKVHSCPKNAKSLDWNQKGQAGPRGVPGPAGTARDAGTVVSVGQGGPQFYPEGLKGWRSVTSTGTGVYCLVPDASSNGNNTSLLLSPGSPGGGSLGIVGWGGYCTGPGGAFGLTVATYTIAGVPDNDLPFEAVIPSLGSDPVARAANDHGLAPPQAGQPLTGTAAYSRGT
jgi:hypothetical protein